MSVNCVSAEQCKEWNSWVDRTPHDFYHRAEYHALCAQRAKAAAYLAVYGNAERFVAWPYLLLPIEEAMAGVRSERYDVTSVYGYAGPLATGCEAGGAFAREAIQAIKSLWLEQSAVAAFSRTHPLLDNMHLLESNGELSELGLTVSIDLTLDAEEVWSRYRRSHRYEIRRARRMGLEFYHDIEWTRMGEFVRSYRAAMLRVRAPDRYLFDEPYFDRFRRALAHRAHLFIVLAKGEFAAGAIFAECCGVVQYHLSASAQEHQALSPSKLLLDGVRLWAQRRGNNVLHLGGGVGSSSDSLFMFKSGFSDRRHVYFTWHDVLDNAAYCELSDRYRRACAQNGVVVSDPAYFPVYRAPVARAVGT